MSQVCQCPHRIIYIFSPYLTKSYTTVISCSHSSASFTLLWSQPHEFPSISGMTKPSNSNGTFRKVLAKMAVNSPGSVFSWLPRHACHVQLPRCRATNHTALTVPCKNRPLLPFIWPEISAFNNVSLLLRQQLRNLTYVRTYVRNIPFPDGLRPVRTYGNNTGTVRYVPPTRKNMRKW